MYKQLYERGARVRTPCLYFFAEEVPSSTQKNSWLRPRGRLLLLMGLLFLFTHFLTLLVDELLDASHHIIAAETAVAVVHS